MKLTLKKPVKHWFVTQYFGNKSSLYPHMKGHNGIDLVASHGAEIYASHDGVAYYQIDTAGGHGVIIITDKQYDWENGQAYFKSLYWHLVDPIKEPKYRSPIQDFPYGKPVKAGDLIGYADSTGHSTGTHLHYGLKPVSKGESPYSYSNIEQGNGYFGAIDPFPYMDFNTTNVPVPITPTWQEKFKSLLKLNHVRYNSKTGSWEYYK